jgi:AGCS family alanine or glycine:cation symporter
VVSIISAGVLLPGVQANSVADGIQNAFEIDTWKSGIVVSLIFGAIVFGGVKESLHKFVVPIMAIIYIVIIGVIVIDIDQLPGVIALVLKVLLTWKLVLEPFWFSSSMGCKRGFILMKQVRDSAAYCRGSKCFTLLNKVSQSFSVYIDTLLVCSATGSCY